MKLITTLIVIGAVACGSAALTPPKMTDAKSDIKAADAVGAADEPRAALHLKLARDEVHQAEALLKDGDEDKADLVLERARVDAQIALVTARGAKARADANDAAKRVEGLSRD